MNEQDKHEQAKRLLKPLIDKIIALEDTQTRLLSLLTMHGIDTQGCDDALLDSVSLQDWFDNL